MAGWEAGRKGLNVLSCQNGKLRSKNHTKKKTITTQNVNLLH